MNAVGPSTPYSRLAGVYDEIVVDPSYGRWASYLHDLWHGDEVGVRTVLDVCCGTGLMTHELRESGYEVTGVDASEAMLARARELLGPDVPLLPQTLPDLQVDGVFDAAVSTFDGLNYLPPADLRLTLAALATRLRPGGWLVFDLHTDAMMRFTASTPIVEGADGGYMFRISSDVDTAARTCDTRIDMTRDSDGDAFNEVHRQYFFSDTFVRDALAQAGFDRVSVTDEYTAAPADETTLRASWNARRAG